MVKKVDSEVNIMRIEKDICIELKIFILRGMLERENSITLIAIKDNTTNKL